MQGANALLNTVTIPPGASVNNPRLVMDGVRGAMFLYGAGGAFIGSWASAAGTDPYGNAYPQGFLGEQGTISGTNFLVYAGVPALGNLIGSWSATGGVDAYGNVYPQGFMAQPDQAGTVQNIFSIQDGNGNTIASIDGSGNLTAQNIYAGNDIFLNGVSMSNVILPEFPLGITNRGWVTTLANWPTIAIGNSETAILELDFTVPANRAYLLLVPSVTFIPTVAVNNQMIQRLKYTTDGSTPTTSSAQAPNKSPGVAQVVTTQSGGNMPTPYMEWVMPILTADQLYRVLLTASIGGSGNSFQYANASEMLEMRTEDVGFGATGNTGVAIGSGTSGSSGRQTYTKTYYVNATHSYYGATSTYGSGHYGKRNDNGTMWQGCPSGHAFYEGDQYSFAMFNYSQINSDLSGATFNWAKLSLNNLSSYYSGGGNVICGYTTYTGAFGDPFQPGAGTHSDQEVWHINKGATLNHQLGSWFSSVIMSGSFTGFIFGPSASYTNGTDLNNFISLYGYATPNSAVPHLQINYTK